MGKLTWRSALLGTAGLLAFAAAVGLWFDESRYEYLLAGLTPCSLRLADSHGSEVGASFDAVWNEPHYVALVFTGTAATADLRELWVAAITDVGSKAPQQVALDFDWRMLSGATVIGRGTGRSRVTGVSGGEQRFGLEFGEVPLRAGERYRLVLSPGKAFWSSLPAAPVLEVGVARAGPSESLAIERSLGSGPSAVCALLGVFFLGGAWYFRRRAYAA